jgi:hypothetical protein
MESLIPDKYARSDKASGQKSTPRHMIAWPRSVQIYIPDKVDS